MSVQIKLRGLEAVEKYFRQLPQVAHEAARLAVNEGAKYGARRSSEAIRQQIAFSRTYIGDAANPGARLRLTRMARKNDLEAVLTARERPTSLARFASGTPTFGRRKRGPRVRVKATGATRTISKGFFVRLRSGDSGELGNIGLAVRLKKGERIKNKRTAIQFSKGIALLYGPSVAQVFNTVREDVSGDVANRTQSEFFRHFERLSR